MIKNDKYEKAKSTVQKQKIELVQNILCKGKTITRRKHDLY